MRSFALWWLAARPRTLPLSVSPVILGTLLAFAENGKVLWLPFFVAIFSAMCIQIGTNLFNDVADFEKGADTPERLGPPRVVANGWLPAKLVKQAAYFSFLLALLSGVYLVQHAGWFIFFIGVFSLLSGWAYTCGPYPIAYHPLGEIFVWIFFGVLAVSGSFYLQSFHFSLPVFFVSGLTGMLAAAVITINNYRDLNEDKTHQKNTLAVFLGEEKIKLFFTIEMLLPFCLLPFLLKLLHFKLILPFLCLPFAFKIIRLFLKEKGKALNALLAFCARLQFVFSVLLGLAFCWG